MSLRTGIASVLMLGMLSGCVTSSGVHNLPRLNPQFLICFMKVVGPPALGPLTQSDVFAIIAALKTSETAKSQCGLRLIAFYDKLRLQKGVTK